MRKRLLAVVTMLVVVAGIECGVRAAEKADSSVYSLAIFPFSERGSGVKGYGGKISDILFASLVADANLLLVDREELAKTLNEQELSLSGMVKPAEAVQVGQLTGARLIVTGSIIEVDKTLYLVGKVIGTETSRVLGTSVKGSVNNEIGPLAEQLATKLSALVGERGASLMPTVRSDEDRIAAVRKLLGDSKRPSVKVSIVERHVGQATIDPAAETEMAKYCKETGFDVIDSSGSAKQADLLLKGEGFSEFAMRRGNMVSVKARVEIKAIDRTTDKLVAIDRQTVVEIDLTEQIAGKKALQKAAALIAERMLPKLVKQ